MSGGRSFVDPSIDLGAKSACVACGQPTRGSNDMLCANCWLKAPRDAVAEWRLVWNRVRFEGQPEALLTRATEDLGAVVRGEPKPNHSEDIMPRSIPQAKRTLTCSCGESYQFTPGIGRPPTKCLECRGATNAPVKREAPAAARTGNGTPRAIVTAPLKALPVPLPVASVEQLRVAPGDVAAIRQTVQDEIRKIEHALSTRLRLMRALDEYTANQPLNGN